MKKKYKRAGTTSERQDYRKGGQVSKDGPRQKFYYGGAQGDGDIGLAAFDMANFPRMDLSPAPIFVAQPKTGNQMVTSTFKKLQEAVKGASGKDNVGLTPQQEQANREALAGAAAGQVPVAGQIPAVQQVDTGIQQQGTIKDTPTDVGTTQIGQVPQEAVSTVDTLQVAPTPTVAPAATMQPAQVEQAPTATAAQTQVSDDAIAKVAGVFPTR